MNKPILLISPHSDDISFSMGGVIANHSYWVRANVHMLTVYNKSNHAPYHSSSDISEITAIRTREDKQFCKQNHFHYFQLGFTEALVRGYQNTADIFELKKPEDDDSYLGVKATLSPLLAEYDLVFAPLGIGNHIEHRILQKIVAQLAPNKALFYEDLPYAADYTSKINTEIAHSQLNDLLPYKTSIGNDLQKKETLLNIYSSQIGPEELLSTRRYHNNNKASGTDDERQYQEIVWGRQAVLEKYKKNLST
ncbi:PIG-L deacetylase family protein [Shewanella surugensis]|uniref:PIG-L family deacetylase n=1 Tax=Shewanella surugensis TaxID=212020 RepID=A0ABT0LHR4_9GAMM|nr:PIG-L family deacetylase [Shewanella surugensis]MCL1127229.1 PIG-L family deacetylase [Shewanella surugensis]